MRRDDGSWRLSIYVKDAVHPCVFHFTFTLIVNRPFHYITLARYLFALLDFCHQHVCCFVQAVLSAHDTVAQKNFDPVLPPLPEDLDDDFEEESVKIVRLVKNKEPLVRRR